MGEGNKGRERNDSFKKDQKGPEVLLRKAQQAADL